MSLQYVAYTTAEGFKICSLITGLSPAPLPLMPASLPDFNSTLYFLTGIILIYFLTAIFPCIACQGVRSVYVAGCLLLVYTGMQNLTGEGSTLTTHT